MIKPNWGEFWYLNRQAHVAGEAVDRFDLSDQPASRNEWNDLLRDEGLAAVSLIEYVVEHRDELTAAAIGEARSTPTQGGDALYVDRPVP